MRTLSKFELLMLITLGATLAFLPASAQVSGTATLDERQIVFQQATRDLEQARQELYDLSAKIAGNQLEQEDLTRKLIALTVRIQTLETRMSENERTLARLRAQISATKKELDQMRLNASKFYAVLQRIALNPTTLLGAQEREHMENLRAASMVNSITLTLERQSGEIAGKVAALKSSQTALDVEGDTLLTLSEQAKVEREQVNRLLDLRSRELGKLELDQKKAGEKSEQLSEQLSSLKDLISAQNGKQGGTGVNGAGPLNPSISLTPSVSFSSLKGELQLPGRGVLLRHFGTQDFQGSVINGDLIATRTDALISAPADGTVIFAGNYRHYGETLIFDMGDDYILLLSGLGKSFVEKGRFVLAGEPVGVMGKPASAISGMIAAPPDQPLIYVEIRRDDVVLDPAQWWNDPLYRKERG